jgi:hypothetical protein
LVFLGFFLSPATRPSAGRVRFAPKTRGCSRWPCREREREREKECECERPPRRRAARPRCCRT